MSVAILPIPGVPEELIRVLNDRFRELSSSPLATSSGSIAGLFFTHAKRPDANGTAAGTFGTETDRTVTYQVQTVSSAQVWVYGSGTMSAVFASRPTDLGANDTGFLFLATDTYQVYRWSGSAWVEVTQANLLQIAYASGSLTLTAAYQDIAGATITLTRAGRHLIHASFLMVQQNTVGSDAASILLGQLVADGSAQAGLAQFSVPVAQGLANISQQWSYVPATAGKIVKLQAKKNAGTGTSFVNLGDTSISALWIGP